jgi:gliding motility-associated-like protein
MGCNIPNTYSSNSIVDRGALAPFLDFGNNGKGTLTFTFSRPVTNPILHLDRLGGGYGFGPLANSALLTLLTPNLTLRRLAGNGDHFEVTPNTITRTPDQLFGNTTTAECGTPTVGGAAGSVQIEGIVTTVSFEYELNGGEGFADAIEIVWEFYCDFDQDGIDDNVDLDDDNDGILDTTELAGNLTLDTDNDGLTDATDLDSDGDGCYDVIEAGFSDMDGDGILGTFPDTVNSDGLIINEPDGYTEPFDGDSNAMFDFQENTAPVILEQPINIISCEGENTTISIFVQNQGPIQWQVSTDEGLTWVDLDDDDIYRGANLEHLEIQNIAVDYDNYLYRAQIEFCDTTMSSDAVTLTVFENPNAGIDGTKTFCIDDGPENLFNSLGGNPDMSGIWSPVLSKNNGIFDPSIDTSGTYTYRVDNGLCAPSESVVIVEVIQKPIIANIGIVEFSDNNSIIVEVDGSGLFEYSINGIDYQERPFFDKLEPGNYFISVKDTRGCEITTTSATILGYPKFFTPNDDGYNDYWNIDGITNIQYSIEIYDRYGKLLEILKDGSKGWNGKYNNQAMPSTDYWFRFSTTTGTAKTGHFTLKR